MPLTGGRIGQLPACALADVLALDRDPPYALVVPRYNLRVPHGVTADVILEPGDAVQIDDGVYEVKTVNPGRASNAFMVDLKTWLGEGEPPDLKLVLPLDPA